MKKFILILILFSLVAVNTSSHASEVMLKLCADNLNQYIPKWRLAKVTAEIQEFSVFRKFNPVIASGDFDSNGKIDNAILVKQTGKRKLAVCLQENQSVKVIVISEPYCSDYVVTTKSNSKYYNYDTNKYETLKHDGITVACFERAGATYVYENGKLNMIVTSD